MERELKPRESSNVTVRLAACALLLELHFVGLVVVGDLLASFPRFILLQSSAFLVYLLALRTIRRGAVATQGLVVVVAAAAVFYTTLLCGRPSLSDDVHRYVWDGAVLAALENPYRYAPADPMRAQFQDLAKRVNHAEVSTIYPPLAEFVFALAAMIQPTDRSVRVALTLTVALVALGLLMILQQRGRPLAEVAVVLWCPLFAVETALSGHLEVLPIGLLLLAVAYLNDGRKNLSTIFFAASAASKYFALAVVVALSRRLGLRRVVAVFAVVALTYVPFTGAGQGLWRGLGTYAEHWHFNAPVFAGLVELLEVTNSSDHLKAGITAVKSRLGGRPWIVELYYHVYPQKLARLLIATLFCMVVAVAWWRRLDPVETTAILVYAFIVLTPTLHPWYLLWALPFVFEVSGRGFIALAGLVPLSYHAAASLRLTGSWQESPLILTLQFGPFLMLVAYDLFRRRDLCDSARPTVHTGSIPVRRNFLGPPSPFRGRPFWQRFREDNWPALRTGFIAFWHSKFRLPVLLLALLLLGFFVRSVVRLLPETAGRVVDHTGKPVVGVEFEVLWYASRLTGSTDTRAPSLRRIGEPDDTVLGEYELRSDLVKSGEDGRFKLGGGLALITPGSVGPFMRMVVRAPDARSGEMYPVKNLTFGGNGNIAGALDTARESAPKDLAAALGSLQLPLPGRIQHIDVQGDRIVTAEGDGGARLYRVGRDNQLELLAHRPSGRGSFYHNAAFAEDGVVLVADGAVDIADGVAGLPTRISMEGRFDLLLSSGASRLVMAALEQVSFHATGQKAAYQVYPLRDMARGGDRLGPDLIRASGAQIFYMHSDGTVRLYDTASTFRSPVTLIDQGGSILDVSWDATRKFILAGSPKSISAYAYEGPLQAQRNGRVDVEVLVEAMAGNAAIGQNGVVVVSIKGEELVIDRVIKSSATEIEAASSVRLGDMLYVPRLTDLTTRTVSTGRRRDPFTGASKVESRLVRDTVRLTGAVEVDIVKGTTQYVQLQTGLELCLREDGRNRQLIQAPLDEQRTVYAGADGLPHVLSWSELAAKPK